MTPETKLKNKVIDALKKLKSSGRNVWWFKVHGSSMQQAGVPDLFIACDGRAMFVELKTGTNVASKIQEHVIQKIRSSGIVAEVCRTVEEVMELINADV